MTTVNNYRKTMLWIYVSRKDMGKGFIGMSFNKCFQGFFLSNNTDNFTHTEVYFTFQKQTFIN